MMKTIGLTKQDIKRHVLFWILIICFLHSIDPLKGPLIAHFVCSGLTYLNFGFAYYFLALFVFPRYLGKSILLTLCGIIFTLIIHLLIDYINFYHIFKFFEIHPEVSSRPIKDFIFETFLIFCAVAACAASFYRNMLSRYKLKEQNKKNKAMLLKELSLFKCQYNMHTTLGFLKFCHNEINRYSKEAARAIELFSHMVTYTIHTKPEEKVRLANEITYIDNFIQLRKLLSSKVYVDFSAGDVTGDLYIFPRILITFVENAFKHGLFNQAKEPLKVNLAVEGKKMLFSVKNKTGVNKKSNGAGIGQYNAIQMLELFYKNNYKLVTKKQHDEYVVDLTLNL